MTFEDKTSNMYRLTKGEHNKLLRNAFTSKYKKTNTKTKDEINKKGKEILKKEKPYTDLISMKKIIVFSLLRVIKKTSKTTQQSD